MSRSTRATEPEARAPHSLVMGIWYEPVLFGVILLSTVFMTPPPLSFWDTLPMRAEIGGYLSPVLTQSFSVLGTVGTVVVALAVWTRFGLDSSTVPERLRRVLAQLLGITTLLLGVMATCVVYVGIGDSSRWPEVGIVLILSWILSLASRLTLGPARLRARAKSARCQWRRAKRRAGNYGLTTKSNDPKTKGREVALIALTPVIAWLGIAATVVIVFWDPSDPWLPSVLTLYGVFPTMCIGMLSFVWVATRDRSAEPVRSLPPMVVVAVVAAAILACVVWLFFLGGDAPLRWRLLGIIALSMFAACAALCGLPRLRRQISWIRAAEDTATIRSLRQTKRYAKYLKRQARAEA